MVKPGGFTSQIEMDFNNFEDLMDKYDLMYKRYKKRQVEFLSSVDATEKDLIKLTTENISLEKEISTTQA